MAALLTYHRSTPADFAFVFATAATDWMAALSTHITANSVHPSAYWEIVEYVSSTPRSILMRRKSGAPGRIVIFGQTSQTANAAAVRGTPSVSQIYVGYSKTSTANAVTASWTSAAPLSDIDYIPGIATMFTSNGLAQYHRVHYIESADTFWFHHTPQTTTGFSLFGAGELMQRMNGDALSCIMGSGIVLQTTWPSSVATTSALFPAPVAADNTYAVNRGSIVFQDERDSPFVNKLCFRAFAFSGISFQQLEKLVDYTTTRAHFYPIWFVANTTYPGDCIVGKLRQVAFGPNGPREMVMWDNRASPIYEAAYGAGYTALVALNSNSMNPAVWFTNFEV